MKRRATLPNPIRTSDSSGSFMRRVATASRREAGRDDEQIAQTIEAGAVVLRRLTETKTEVTVHAEVIAGDDQHALLLAQTGHERGRVDRMVVAHVDNGARFGRDPVEAACLAQPLLHQRQVAAQDAARAFEQARPPLRRERHAREPIAQRARRDGDVVVVRPQRRDQRRRTGDPADAQARQSVGFRQAAGDDGAVASGPTSRRSPGHRAPRPDTLRPRESRRHGDRPLSQSRRARRQ